MYTICDPKPIQYKQLKTYLNYNILYINRFLYDKFDCCE